MNVTKTVLKNVASSWVGLGSQILVTLLLTPFVIAKLGAEAYGIWLLMQGFVGYYGFVDMGLRAGLTQSITRRIAEDDVDGVRRHIAAASPILGGLALVIMSVALAVCFLLPHFVEMSEDLASQIWLVVLFQAFGAAVKMPIQPFGAVLVGIQRYDIANAIGVLTRVLFALLTWFALGAGAGLIGLSIVLMATNCIDSLIRMVAARRLLPGIRGAGFTLDRGELREIANVGVWNFLIGISKQFIYFSDAIVVGILFSAKAVTPYGIAASLVDYGNKVIVSGTKVLFPTIAHLLKNGSIEEQRSLYVTATRATLGISSAIVTIGIIWITPFLEVWLESSPDKDMILADAPYVFLVLGVAFAFVGFQRVGIQFLLAKQRLRLVATLMIVEALVNLVLSLVLGRTFGVIGVAYGTLIPALFLGLFAHLPILADMLELRLFRMLLVTLLKPAFFACSIAALLSLIAVLLPRPSSWVELVGAGGIGLFAVVLCSPILLSPDQLRAVSDRVRGAVARKYQPGRAKANEGKA